MIATLAIDMFFGAHFLIYTSDPHADRAFLRDVLEFPYVDAGNGWLLFAAPPTELASHFGPVKEGTMAECHLYLMCEDIHVAVKRLTEKGVSIAPIHEERWGIMTTFRLPGGGEVGLYQPKHPLAISK